MWHDRTRLALLAVLLLAVIGAVVFSLRDGGKPPSVDAPTVDISQVQTKAVLAFANGLTSTALAVPTGTLTATPQAASTVVSTESVSPTPSCYRLHFVKDVTVPDNTPMTPAQVFTKTWLVENTGTCTWLAGSKVILVGGLAMGGSPFSLLQPVGPGGRVQISIKMVAPTNQTGTVQGTWRLTDPDANPFGDAMWVTIDVGGTGKTPLAATATATP